MATVSWRGGNQDPTFPLPAGPTIAAFPVGQWLPVEIGTPGIIAFPGDADWSPTTEDCIIYAAPIGAARAVTLPTSGPLLVINQQITVIRKATCTGAFNINVGTGPLKAMATAGSFATVYYDGTNWILGAYGTL